MNIRGKEQSHDALYEALLTLQTPAECAAFFEDLCTVSEIQAMSQRLEVAKMLRAQSPYSEIVEKTGASSATISRVGRCLNYGKDGYKTVLKRLDEVK